MLVGMPRSADEVCEVTPAVASAQTIAPAGSAAGVVVEQKVAEQVVVEEVRAPELPAQPKAPVDVDGTRKLARPTTWANVRQGPGNSYAIERQLDPTQEIWVIVRASSWWPVFATSDAEEPMGFVFKELVEVRE